MSQMSLWSAGAREPAVGDLDGLLAGPGHISVRDDLARIGVVVAVERAAPLAAALRDGLGLDAEIVEISGESGLAVRTPWLAALRPVAAAWQRGAMSAPPAGWTLDGPRLRWWCIAAGWAVEEGRAGYALGLSPTNPAIWSAVGSALSAAGVGGALVGPRAGGPAYRVVGRRRLVRLRELTGDPPPGLEASLWPPRNDPTVVVAP